MAIQTQQRMRIGWKKWSWYWLKFLRQALWFEYSWLAYPQARCVHGNKGTVGGRVARYTTRLLDGSEGLRAGPDCAAMLSTDRAGRPRKIDWRNKQ